jgi:hypothetical protein
MSRNTVTVIDNRTGRICELAIEDGALRAQDLRQITLDDGEGLVSFDPGFTNTAACRSAITHVDGEAGILQHRGYRIEELCQHSTFLEVAYLLIHGDLPGATQLERWMLQVNTHNFVHENVKRFLQGFRYDAQPIAMLAASVGALSSFYPVQDLRSTGQDPPRTTRRPVRDPREEPAQHDRSRTGETRARRRVLHLAQCVPQRRSLLRTGLRGDRGTGSDVPSDVRAGAERAGSPSGSRWSAIPSSRQSAHARSTRASSTGAIFQSQSAIEAVMNGLAV